MCQPACGVMVGERNHTLGLGGAEGVGVRAVIVSVVAPLAVVAVLACWAIPDSVSRVELFAEVAPVREGEGLSGVTSLHVVVMILWHGVPLEVMVVSVFYSCGQGYSTSTHGLRSVLVWNESAMVEIRMDS